MPSAPDVSTATRSSAARSGANRVVSPPLSPPTVSAASESAPRSRTPTTGPRRARRPAHEHGDEQHERQPRPVRARVRHPGELDVEGAREPADGCRAGERAETQPSGLGPERGRGGGMLGRGPERQAERAGRQRPMTEGGEHDQRERELVVRRSATSPA